MTARKANALTKSEVVRAMNAARKAKQQARRKIVRTRPVELESLRWWTRNRPPAH